jgi:hypothetical protein
MTTGFVTELTHNTLLNPFLAKVKKCERYCTYHGEKEVNAFIRGIYPNPYNLAECA